MMMMMMTMVILGAIVEYYLWWSAGRVPGGRWPCVCLRTEAVHSITQDMCQHRWHTHILMVYVCVCVCDVCECVSATL